MGGEAGKGDKPCPILISDGEWGRLWDIALPPKPTEPSDPGDENDHEQK